MNKLKLLLSFMKGTLVAYTSAIILIFVSTAIAMLNPLVIKITMDSVLGDIPPSLPGFIGDWFLEIGGRTYFLQNLWVSGLILVMLSLVDGVVAYLYRKNVAASSEIMAKNVRTTMFDHIQHLTYSYHVKAETGDLIQRCTSDLETLRSFLANQFFQIVRAVALVSSALVIMLSLNPRLTLISFSITPVLTVSAYIFYRFIKEKFKVADEAEGRMTTILQENLSSMRIVRAFARQDYEIDKFVSASNDYRNKDFVISRLMAWYWSLSDMLCDIQIGFILILGTFWAAQGLLTVGTLYAFTNYASKLIWPLRQLGRVLADMGRASVSLTRIKEVLDELNEDKDDSTGMTPEIHGNIVFENVSFSYDEGHPILKNLSFTIEKGQTVALLGGTGSGKSTLMNLLVKLFDYDSGSVKIDGVELRDINKKWLRRNIGIVLQEPFLFSRTIRENLAIARNECSMEELERVTRIASVFDVITGFEKGFETMVGEKGVTLSGGQKQRVAIARMLLENHPVMIFDDSLSAVDVETDAHIREQLKIHCSQVTTFIISHRISTLMQADKILVMEDGEITQSGTHSQLVMQDGLYKEVFDIQNSLEEDIKISIERDGEYNA
ncbi:MAG: ABC transporter ATP-binding protein [Clostridia bacterium]|nr:ABC transporter ATP-binding protein [Clostridia bacterium]MBN2882721.1 ABC transporter ATP-binding protein [Clostridia bacterium]